MSPHDNHVKRDELHVYVHLDPEVAALLSPVPAKLDLILSTLHTQGAQLMSIAEDLNAAKAALVTANETTNEIADDIDELMAKTAANIADSEAAAALKAESESFTTRLRGVADKYTKDAPPAETV